MPFNFKPDDDPNKPSIRSLGTGAQQAAAGNSGGGGGALLIVNNLSDLNNAATARTNLGVPATAAVLAVANNLSDLNNAATARTNLGVPATASVLAVSNNLSDVANAATSRTNILAAGRFVSINPQAGNYTLVIGDAIDTVIEMTSASANNLTIPLNATVAFVIGTIIEVCQIGAGQTTVVATGGVTLRSDASKVKIAGQYGSISLRKRAADEWVLAGDLA